MSDRPRTIRWSPRPPAARLAVCATSLPSVRGERVVLVDWRGDTRGHYAWTNVYTIQSLTYVDVCTEWAWWSHRLLRTHPETRRWPASLVWVE